MSRIQRTFSPIDGSLLVERQVLDGSELHATAARARQAQARWRAVSLAERIGLARAFVERFVEKKDDIASELTRQMGRPIRHSPGEVRGLSERATFMADIAPSALADLDVGDKAGFTRFIRREPLGVVLVLAPWNYPYLTAVNS